MSLLSVSHHEEALKTLVVFSVALGALPVVLISEVSLSVCFCAVGRSLPFFVDGAGGVASALLRKTAIRGQFWRRSAILEVSGELNTLGYWVVFLFWFGFGFVLFCLAACLRVASRCGSPSFVD